MFPEIFQRVGKVHVDHEKTPLNLTDIISASWDKINMENHGCWSCAFMCSICNFEGTLHRKKKSLRASQEMDMMLISHTEQQEGCLHTTQLGLCQTTDHGVVGKTSHEVRADISHAHLHTHIQHYPKNNHKFLQR